MFNSDVISSHRFHSTPASSARTVTRLRKERESVGGYNVGSGKTVLCSPNCQDQPSFVFCPVGTGNYPPRLMQREPEADRSPPSSAVVKND